MFVIFINDTVSVDCLFCIDQMVGNSYILIAAISFVTIFFMASVENDNKHLD